MLVLFNGVYNTFKKASFVKTMKKVFVALIVIAGVASCAKAPKDWHSTAGRPYSMRINPQQYEVSDNDWKEGFNDGCVTGMQLGSSGAQRMAAPQVDGWKMTGRNKANPDEPHPLIKSAPVYMSGYMDGYEHCFYQYDWWVF